MLQQLKNLHDKSWLMLLVLHLLLTISLTTTTTTEPTPPAITSVNNNETSATESTYDRRNGEKTPAAPPTKSAVMQISTSTSEKMEKELNNLAEVGSLERVRNLEEKLANISADENCETETEDFIVFTEVISLTQAKPRIFDVGLQSDELGSHVEIPVSEIRPLMTKNPEKITVALVWWKDTTHLPAPKHGIIPRNSSALSISYFSKNTEIRTKRSFPIKYFVNLRQDFTKIDSLKPHERLIGVDRHCAWIDLETGDWKTSGCNSNYTGDGVYCECNHTTTFVTLLMLNSEINMPSAVYTVTMVLQILSIICLFLTINFIAIARYGTGIDSSSASCETAGMNTNRTNSQLSLCVSLIFMHIMSVIGGWIRSQSDDGCIAIAVLTHYFLLASAFWSLCEGLGIFTKLSSFLTMKIEYRSITWIQIFLGWGVPFLITFITAVYGIQSDNFLDMSCRNKGNINGTCNGLIYPRYDDCWLSRESGMIWAAMGPLITILLINIFIFAYVTIKVVRIKRKHPTINFDKSDTQCANSNCATSHFEGTLSRSNGAKPTAEFSTGNSNSLGSRSTLEYSAVAKRRFTYIISISRSFGILMPILGVPWFVGILANIEGAGIALSSTHAVINGLQGFLLFLLYCVSSRRDFIIVKRKWRNSALNRVLNRRKYHVRRESVRATTPKIKSRPEQTGNTSLHPNQTNGSASSQFDTLSSRTSSNGTLKT